MIIQIEKLKLCTPNNFKLINFLLYILFFNIYVPNHLNDFLFTTDSLYEQGEYKKTFILLSDEYEKSSNDVRIAFRYARSIFMLANTEKNIQKQNELYYYGLAKAQEALLLDTNNAYSNFWYASYLGKIGQIFTLLCVALLINAYNYIDGMDGLLASISSISTLNLLSAFTPCK